MTPLLSRVEKHFHAQRFPSGGFISAPSDPIYRAIWIRDHLYAALAYYSLSYIREFQSSIWFVFDLFYRYREKLYFVIEAHGEVGKHDFLHARYEPTTLSEYPEEWGHHQLDAIGLFLFIVGEFHSNRVRLVRDERDRALLRTLVAYLEAVRYFEKPDYGMWEWCFVPKSSSIGAVVAGLQAIHDSCLVFVPHNLIRRGCEALTRLLPYETSEGRCVDTRHDHSSDIAQLSLVWPYRLLEKEEARAIVERIVSRLTRPHGVWRYEGDVYEIQRDGSPLEWQWDFWISIAYSFLEDYAAARSWFDRGMSRVTPQGHIPEAYQDGRPNGHSPLTWTHSLCLVAHRML